MSKLGEILREEAARSTWGGSTKALIERLDEQRRVTDLIFVVLFALLVCMVGLGGYGLWRYMTHGTVVDAVAWSGAAGLAGSLPMVGALIRVWSTWSRIRLITVVLADASPAVAKSVVTALAKSIK